VKSLLIACIALLATAAAPPDSSIQGFWSNPAGTVKVRIGACGPSLCGTVVSAASSAIADARDSGYPSLVGMQLLHDYRAAGQGQWQGTIFVPDLGRSFASRIELVDSGHVRVSGCLLGRFFCKSQMWRRA
jgi:uncharacterized protein (DUF2147 family)